MFKMLITDLYSYRQQNITGFNVFLSWAQSATGKQ